MAPPLQTTAGAAGFAPERAGLFRKRPGEGEQASDGPQIKKIPLNYLELSE